MATVYIVKSSAAKMPSGCWGQYRRVAVLEMEDGAPEPRMISERARGVVRIVRTWERLYCGSTDRCAYARALAAAEEMADVLNAVRAELSIRLAEPARNH